WDLGFGTWDFSPKVSDFGLAKYLPAAAPGRPDSPTRPGLIVGTPQYMAPEQAATTPEAVGPAADVYSLGAILYELLAGRPPFQGANAMDTLLQVRLLEPIPPRVWQPRVPRDLETVCLKCLAKDPRHRYGSARELADDLRRFIDGVPIRARQASLTERAWKATRRHPAVAALGLVAALAAVVAFAGMTWQWRRAEDRRAAPVLAHTQTAAALDRAEQGLYVSRIAQAGEAVHDGNVTRATELLRLCRPAADRPDRRGWEWYYLHTICAAGRDPGPQVVAKPLEGVTVSAYRGTPEKVVSPDDRLAATVRDGAIVIADAATGRELERLTAAVPVSAVAFSPDGRRLAAVGPAAVVLWDTATWQPVLTLQLPAATRPTGDASRMRVAFSADGRRLTTTAGSGGAAVWGAGTDGDGVGE
ncbi:MAG TPA: serine/threonine-protein kinase, partial [Gemmataceae bacterium]